MSKTKMFWLFAILLLIFNIIEYLTKWGGESNLTMIGDLMPVICSLVSAICLFSAFRQFKKIDLAKIAWFLIFIGIAFDFMAESTYAYYELILKMDMNSAFPFIGDYIWCFAYFPFFIGLTMVFIGYKKSGFPLGNVKIYGIISLFVIVVFVLCIYFLLIPIINDPETEFLARFFYLFYPIGDVVTLVPAIILIYITSLFGKGIISKPWKYIAFGFVCFTFADLMYSYLSWIGEYKSGNMIDVAWNAGYLIIGLGGLYQKVLVESMNKEVKI
jgi:hypothetical protein